MPLQNRVDPLGRLVATSARGALMGNRGCLHDGNRRIADRPAWTTKAWITCTLDSTGPKRKLMTPGHYTELFFLDEATALAAGHRPCGQCRRLAYQAFKAAFLTANETFGAAAPHIDRRLHADRKAGAKGEHRRILPGDLPDGTMVLSDGQPWLKLGLHLLEWSFGGYRNHLALPKEALAVITPPSTLKALAAGYRPELHSSAYRVVGEQPPMPHYVTPLARAAASPNRQRTCAE